MIILQLILLVLARSSRAVEYAVAQSAGAIEYTDCNSAEG